MSVVSSLESAFVQPLVNLVMAELEKTFGSRMTAVESSLAAILPVVAPLVAAANPEAGAVVGAVAEAVNDAVAPVPVPPAA